MRIFDIYQHPEYGFEAVPRGFSWSAFLIPGLWATWRGLGYPALMMVAWSTLMFDAARWIVVRIDHPALLALSPLVLVAVFGALPGLLGHRWLTDRLRRERYDWKLAVAAATRRRAIAAVRRGRFAGQVMLANGG